MKIPGYKILCMRINDTSAGKKKDKIRDIWPWSIIGWETQWLNVLECEVWDLGSSTGSSNIISLQQFLKWCFEDNASNMFAFNLEYVLKDMLVNKRWGGSAIWYLRAWHKNQRKSEIIIYWYYLTFNSVSFFLLKN